MFNPLVRQMADYFRDFNWNEIKTPIKVAELKQLVVEADYDKKKTKYLIDRFTQGFSLGYEGKTDRQDQSANLPLNGLGTKMDVWNKVMKEVKLGRYAGPYELSELPFQNFIQSPIGLVPKAGGKTRLIFHLSYQFQNGMSQSIKPLPKRSVQ